MWIILISGSDHYTEWILGPYVTKALAEADAKRFMELVDDGDLEYEVTMPESFASAYREQVKAQEENKGRHKADNAVGDGMDND